MKIVTRDTHYTDSPGIAAAYLVHDGERAAFVETNTSRAVPGLLAGLEDVGLTPSDVEFVIVTHIHLDHAGGAGLLMASCPNATLLAHPRAAPHAIDPTRIVAGATAVYGPEAFRDLYGEIRPIAADWVRSMDDEATVSFGSGAFRFLHTRGHANHHFCVGFGDAMFTGDSFGIRYPALQRNGRFVFPSTSPTDFDPDAAHESVDRIVAAGPQRVFPTHFGEATDVHGFAGDLHRWLDTHGEILEAADRHDLQGDELDTFCQAQVRAVFERELAAAGLLGDAEAIRLTALDLDLNAQGIAFALRKRRFKRDQSGSTR